MKIKCDASILNDKTSSEMFFDCLSAHRSNHCIDITNVRDLIDKHCEDNLIVEKLKKLSVLSANYSYHCSLTISMDNNDSKSYSIENLNEILSKKAIVILENEFSDSGFLDSVLHSQGRDWLLKLKNTAWEVKGTGGCGEIPKAIRSEVAKSKGILRLFVIHDSDKIHPGADYSVAQLNIIKAANDNNVICHTLSKREIENYIPDESISNLDYSRKVMIENFKFFTSDQKDHFDYKFGFKKKGGYWKKDDEMFNGLFTSLDDNVYDALKNGFGKNIADEVFLKDIKVNKDAFKVRCVKIGKEFNDICEVIEKIL